MIYYYIAINIITFLLFSYDKQAAKSNSWRIRESILLGLILLGGCFGAYLSMLIVRHKTKKPLFIGIIIVSLLMHGFIIYRIIFY